MMMASYDDPPFDGHSYGRHSMSELATSKLESKLASQQGSSTLNLGDAFIGDEGCSLIANYLRDNTHIRNIELRGNNISLAGLRLLLPALKHLTALTVLSFEWNNLENNISLLTEVLMFCNSLQVLDLRNNKIGAEGARAVGRLLESNSSVERVDLRWNDLGQNGAKCLLQALKGPHHVQSLELSGNRIPEELIQEIQSCLRGRTLGGSRGSPSRSPVRDEENMISKYEMTMLANARQEAKISELEQQLDQGTRGLAELREELTRELDVERSKRLFAEETLTLLKEDSYQKDQEMNRLKQDFESSLYKVGAERGSAQDELETLRENLNRLQLTHSDKARSLEDKLSYQQRLYKQLDESSRVSFERVKHEHQGELDDLLREHQIQANSSEDSLKHLKAVRETVESENKGLRQQINKLKTQHQSTLTELEENTRQEEHDKFTVVVRGIEQRLATVEDSRDALNKKNQEIQREIMLRDQEHMQKLIETDNALNNAREDLAELQRQLQKAENFIETIKAELYTANTALDRTATEKEELNRALAERQAAHMKKLEQLYQEQTGQRKEMETLKAGAAQSMGALEGELEQVTKERDRVLKEYETLLETVKQRTQACIEEVIAGHVRKLETSLSRS